MDLCQPHQCRCGSLMDVRRLHSFVCKRAPGRTDRQNALNDLITRSFASAGVPVTKEPVGLFRTDGKRPNGLALIPWQSGKSLCWDVTITCPLAASYMEGIAWQGGSTAEMAASRKEQKYTDVEARHVFQPIAMETLGVFNSSARQFVCSLGHRISSSSGEARDIFSLPENLVVVAALQRCPTPRLLAGIRLRGMRSYLFVSFSIFSQTPREYTYRGYRNNNNNRLRLISSQDAAVSSESLLQRTPGTASSPMLTLC